MNKKAFTLIELLVVISIIALLMAMLMPALARARKQAKAVACQMNLKQWCMVFSMYTSDNGGFFPNEYHVKGGWLTVSRPYYKDEKLLLCPTATKPWGRGGWQPFAAWVDTEGTGLVGSYGLNDWVLSGWPGIGKEQYERLWRTMDVGGGPQIPMYLDCSIIAYVTPLYSNEPPEYEADVIYNEGPSSGEMKRFCVNRHQGFINGAFLDYSVRKVGLKELWELKWHRNWNQNNAPPPVWPLWMKGFKDYR